MNEADHIDCVRANGTWVVDALRADNTLVYRYGTYFDNPVGFAAASACAHRAVARLRELGDTVHLYIEAYEGAL